MISLLRLLERVAGETFVGSAAELRHGGQLQHRHGLLEDADRLAPNRLLLGFCPVAGELAHALLLEGVGGAFGGVLVVTVAAGSRGFRRAAVLPAAENTKENR